jgi:hypothetical protein
MESETSRVCSMQGIAEKLLQNFGCKPEGKTYTSNWEDNIKMSIKKK